MALITNKQAQHEYEIIKTYEAGIALHGFEVKSLRAKQGSLQGAYVVPRGGEAWLVEAHIPAYQPANTPDDYDPNRTRKLLLHKEQIQDLAAREQEGGVAIIPLSMYNSHGRIKVKVAVARGKSKHDKRKTIKERDMQREVQRELKRRQRNR